MSVFERIPFISSILKILNNETVNINVSNEDLQKCKLTLSTNSKSVDIIIIIDYLDDGNLKLELIYDKLLKQFIKNSTRKETVYVFEKNNVEHVCSRIDYLHLHKQFQIVFAYLELIEHKNEKQKLKLISKQDN
jgi:hypothetical protein